MLEVESHPQKSDITIASKCDSTWGKNGPCFISGPQKQKEKFSGNKKSAPPFLAHSLLSFGVFNVQLHIS